MISKMLLLGLVLCGQVIAHGTVTTPHTETNEIVSREAENKQYCYYYSCSTCTAQGGCGWCASTQTCLGGGSSGPTYGTCSSWSYYASACDDTCASRTSCSSCTSGSSCGWCASTGTCSRGSSSGPTTGYCSSSSWSYLYSSCPATCDCTYSSDTTYSCPNGYEKQGTWCDDKCCGTILDCCKVTAWAVAISILIPVVIIASCITCCCFACTGCPGHSYRMRQQQAQIGYRPPQTAYASRVAVAPTAVVSAVPSVQTQSVITDSQSVPLVKC